jgi:7-carboxy-7-deazaguanine synthase
MARLLARGYQLMIETSGERPLADVPKAVHKIMDVKCPGSGESDRFHFANLDTLTQLDEVKFVITNRRDYEFARDFMQEHSLAAHVKDVLFSPAFTNRPSPERDASNCTLDPRQLVEWMLEDGVPARLNLQIHKFVWEPAMKGV